MGFPAAVDPSRGISITPHSWKIILSITPATPGKEKALIGPRSCRAAVPTSVLFMEVAMFGRRVMELIQYVVFGLGIIGCITGITALIMAHSGRR